MGFNGANNKSLHFELLKACLKRKSWVQIRLHGFSLGTLAFTVQKHAWSWVTLT